MLHLPAAYAEIPQLNSGYKKKLNLVTVRRQAWSYFTYAAQEEVKQKNLKQAALCQVYEDFTGIYSNSNTGIFSGIEIWYAVTFTVSQVIALTRHPNLTK